MSITEKISHAAERKAFETILDSMIKKVRPRISATLPSS